LAADIAGYSALVGSDEARTVRDLKQHQSVVLPMISEFGGNVIDTAGDGILAEFGSIVNAAECAMAIQRTMAERNATVEAARRMQFRIGLNLGDVIYDESRIYGDGINIAARLEGLAPSGGIVISEDAWRQVQGKVATSVVDLGEKNLKNIARPIRAFRIELDSHHAGSPKVPGREAEDKPSIAVLPFQNMSGDSEQDYFCDGLVEDIITTLSKIAGLRVIARNSSFVYRDRHIDVRQAARELGVRFVLEGSVRRTGNRVRITAQLIDAADGAHLWAERYDRVVEDIFAVQDEITLVLATEMQVKLTEGEQARLRHTTTNNIEAWTYWVQGLAYYRRPPTKESMGRARGFWEKALALDPRSAVLNAMLGFIECLDARFGWWIEREAALAKAQAFVDAALDLEPINSDAHRTLSVILLFRRRFDEAAAVARRAAELAPNSADVAEIASFVLAPSGYPEEAVVQIERAMTLSPNHPPYYLGILGNAYHLAGRIEEAIAAFRAYDARSPGFGLVDLVIIYQQNDRPEEATQTAHRLLAVRRGFTITSWLNTQFRRDQERLEKDVAALRTAGLPMT
jgi:adenylate cyclase